MKKLIIILSVFITLVLFFILSYTPYSLYERYKDSVVKISVSNGVHGSGFYLSTPNKKDIIITVAHICNVFKPYLSVFIDNVEEFNVLKIDNNTDLCALHVTKGTIPDKFKLGSTVLPENITYSMGFPRGDKLKFVEGRYLNLEEGLTGFILDKDVECPKEWSLVKMYNKYSACVKTFFLGKTSIKVDAGCSGSVAFNSWGNAIGVINAMDKENNAYMIMLDDLEKFVEEL